MNATLTFFFGLFILVLFAWYFLTDKERTKRLLGTTLALLLCAFSIDAFLPFEKKIHLGLDLQGGTSFLVRLVLPYVDNRLAKPEKLLVKRRPELTGQDVASARPVFEQRGYEVSLSLTRTG